MNDKHESLSRIYVSGEAQTGFWQMVTRGVALISTFFIWRSLTPYELGVFYLLMAFMSFLAVFFSLGGSAVLNDIQRFVGEKKEPEAKRLFWEYQRYRIVVGVGIWACMFFLGPSMLANRYDETFLALIRVASFFLLVAVADSVVQSIMRTRLAFVALARRKPVGKVAQVLFLGWFFIYGNITTSTLFLSLLLESLTSLLWLVPAVIRAYSPWKAVRETSRPILWSVIRAHGKWDALRQLGGKFAGSIQPWLLKIFLGESGTAAVGVYNVAVQMVDLCYGLFFVNTLGPIMARIAHERERLRFVFHASVKYLVVFGLLLIPVAGLFGTLGVFLLFPHLSAALPLFYVLLITVPLAAFEKVSEALFTVLRRQKFQFVRETAHHIATLSALLVLLPALGAIGAPLSRVIMFGVGGTLAYLYLLKVEPSFAIEPRSILRFTDEDKKFIMHHIGIFFEMARTKLRMFRGG